MSTMPLHQRTAGLVVALATVAGLAGLAACGGQSQAIAPVAPSTSDSMPGMPTATSAAGAPVAANTVSIKNFAFVPATVTVRVGTTITWTNTDQEAHTVTAKNGTFNSPALNAGSAYHYTFTKPGTYNYLCTIHPFMTATVVVTP
jgi:plastocyanin